MRIAISCDENPGDTGTTAGGLVERDENVKVCRFLLTALHRCKQDAWFDDTITFQERTATANEDGTELLVAIAHNASNNPNAEGTVFCFCPGGQTFGKQTQLAQAIGKELISADVCLHWGTYEEDIYECCEFAHDTVYIEVLFQTSTRDVARMQSPGYHHTVAEAVCRGIAQVENFAYVPESTKPTWVKFDATAFRVPLGFYKGPSISSGLLYNSQARKGDPLHFDGWQYGQEVVDPQTGQVDARWYHRAAPGYGWAASAWVNGNAPNSTPE